MDKSILSLIVIGIALAALHVPHTLLTVGIIGCLAIATIRLSWSILEAFSQPSASRRKSAPSQS